MLTKYFCCFLILLFAGVASSQSSDDRSNKLMEFYKTNKIINISFDYFQSIVKSKSELNDSIIASDIMKYIFNKYPELEFNSEELEFYKHASTSSALLNYLNGGEEIGEINNGIKIIEIGPKKDSIRRY